MISGNQLVRRMGIAIFVWGIWALGFSQESYEVDTLSDIRYGDCERCVGDLYLPMSSDETQRFPVVIVIHGGGWGGGNKDKADYQKMAATLAGRGIAGFSINYTLSGGLPEPVYDAKCAVRFLRRHAEDYKLDACNIGASGGSAGAWSTSYLAWTRPEDTTRTNEASYSWDPIGRKHWGYPEAIQAASPLSGTKSLFVEEMVAADLPPALMMTENSGHKGEAKVRTAYQDAGKDAMLIANLDGHGSTLLFNNSGKFDIWLDFFVDNLSRPCKESDPPLNVSATSISAGVEVMWEGPADNVTVYSYAIFRGGDEVGWSRTNTFIDSGASADPSAQYSVATISSSGLRSEKATAGETGVRFTSKVTPSHRLEHGVPQHFYTIRGRKTVLQNRSGWRLLIDPKGNRKILGR